MLAFSLSESLAVKSVCVHVCFTLNVRFKGDTKRRSVYKENVISNEKYLKEDNMEDMKMYHKAEGMYRFLFMLLCKF